MVQTAGNNAQLNETRGAERPPSSPISPAFFINFDVVTRAPSANLAAMSNGRLARFVGAVFVAAVVVAGPGTAAVAHATPAASVGVYPPLIHFDQALRGGEFLDTFGVLNDTGRGEYFNFGLAGATAPWLRLVSSANHATAITKIWAPGGPPNHGRPGAQGPVDSGQRCLPRSSGSRFSPAESHPQGPNDGRAGCGY